MAQIEIKIGIAKTIAHPRSFGFMRVDDRKIKDVLSQVWESPAGELFYWSANCPYTALRVMRLVGAKGMPPVFVPLLTSDPLG